MDSFEFQLIEHILSDRYENVGKVAWQKICSQNVTFEQLLDLEKLLKYANLTSLLSKDKKIRLVEKLIDKYKQLNTESLTYASDKRKHQMEVYNQVIKDLEDIMKQ